MNNLHFLITTVFEQEQLALKTQEFRRWEMDL